MKIPKNNDLHHPSFSFNKFIRYARYVLVLMHRSTTVIELNGIKIAAITGDNSPWTANVSPTILYRSAVK